MLYILSASFEFSYRSIIGLNTNLTFLHRKFLDIKKTPKSYFLSPILIILMRDIKWFLSLLPLTARLYSDLLVNSFILGKLLNSYVSLVFKKSSADHHSEGRLKVLYLRLFLQLCPSLASVQKEELEKIIAMMVLCDGSTSFSPYTQI